MNIIEESMFMLKLFYDYFCILFINCIKIKVKPNILYILAGKKRVNVEKRNNVTDRRR